MTDALTLCYHGVSPTWPAILSVTPERLAGQVEALLRRGYRTTTFSELAAGTPAGRELAITFDDAYRSVIELGLPVLERLGVAATLFVPTAHPGTELPMLWPGIEEWAGGEHERELVPMGWDEVRALRDAGWEIGSHTVTHPRLTDLGDDALAAELGESRERLEDELGQRCRSIAYPYGDVDARVVAVARAAGYDTGAALPKPPHGRRDLEEPRVGVWRGDGSLRFAVKVSPLARRLRGGPLAPVERLLGR